LGVGRRGGVIRQVGQQGAGGGAIAGVEQRARRVRARPRRQWLGEQIGQPRERPPARPLRPGRGPPCRLGETPQRHRRGRHRRIDRRRQHFPAAFRLPPQDQQLGHESPGRDGGRRTGERARDAVALIQRHVLQLDDGIGKLRRNGRHRRDPLQCRGQPVTAALRHLADLDRQRIGPAKGVPAFDQDGMGLVEALVVLERDRPLTPGSGILRGGGSPAARDGRRTVAFAQRGPGAHGESAQRRSRIHRQGPAHKRRQLEQPAQQRQHALQSQQGREIGGIRPERCGVQRGRRLEAPLALELESLTDRLRARRRPRHAPQAERHECNTPSASWAH
jgi:hypothetical protein